MPHLEAVENGPTLVLVAHLLTVIRLGRLLPDAAMFLRHLRAVQMSLQLHVQVLRDWDGPLRGWQHQTDGGLSQDLAGQVWDDYLKTTLDIYGITRHILDYLKITSDMYGII